MTEARAKTSIRIGDQSHVVSLEKRGVRIVASVDGREYRLSVHEPQPGVYSLLPLDDGGRSVEIRVAPGAASAASYRVKVRSRVFEASVETSGRVLDRPGAGGDEGRRALKSVMPGRIVRVLVKAGDAVNRGQGIIVVEAMKMENELVSPKDGKVVEVNAAPGDRVESGTVLAVIE